MADDNSRLVTQLIGALASMSNNPAAVKAKPPKPFSQGSDFSAFVRQYENYATLANIPQDLKKQSLLNLLDNAAFNAATLVNVRDELSYEEFVRRLKIRFEQKNVSDYKRSFYVCAQLPDETIANFRDRLYETALKAYPNMEESTLSELAKDVFLNGLDVPTSVRENLYLQGPADLDSACQAALKLISAHRAASSSVCTPVSKPRSGKGVSFSVPSGGESAEKPAVGAELLQAVRDLTQIVQKLDSGITAINSAKRDKSPVASPRHYHLNSRRGGRTPSFPPRTWTPKTSRHQSPNSFLKSSPSQSSPQ